jgi:uroporphyrinogen decarboxylase
MKGRECFLKVINGEIPERVPVTLFIADQGHFINQVYPNIDKKDHLQTQLKVIDIQKQLGADVYVRLLYGVVPLWLHYGGVNTEVQTDNWEVHTEEFKKGRNSIVKSSTINTPDGKITQDFTTNEISPGSYVYACTKKPVKTKEDLDIIMKYEPGMSKAYPEKVKKIVSIIKEAVGDDGIVGTWSPHGPFNNASLLINLDSLYSLFLTDFKFYEKLMNFSIDRFKDYTNAISDSGIDVHSIGANVAGGFVGKKLFDKYILPFEKKYIDIVQSKGIPALYHNCGDIMNLVESYIEVGAKMVEPFSPHPLGDGDLSEAKRRSKGSFVIIGNVDQVNVLKPGPIEKIKKVTEETVEVGKVGGKFILQSADFLEYDTPLENLEAYVKTGIEYGNY